MAEKQRCVGLDVAKASIDVARGPTGRVRRLANDGAALHALADELRRAGAVVALEPSGGYERPAIAVLAEHGVPVRRLDARRVRRFAEATGRLAKTDRLDARVLAAALHAHDSGAAELTPVVAYAEPDPEHEALSELVAYRRLLAGQRASLAARDKQLTQSAARAANARQLAALQAEIDDLAAKIDAQLRRPRYARARRILLSVPGIGALTAGELLAGLPELGRLNAKRLAALAGLAPIARESGDWQGQRHIAGGRRRVRNTLYMAALAAMRHIPHLIDFRQRKRDQSKPAKTIIVACMRKLLILINTLIREDRTYQHQAP